MVGISLQGSLTRPGSAAVPVRPMKLGEATVDTRAEGEPVRAPTLLERVKAAPPAYRYGTALALVPYLVVMGLTTGNRPEQFAIVGTAVALSLWSDATRAFFKSVVALLVFGVVYDLTHLTEPLVRFLHVHIAEPYNFDKAYFAIASATGPQTPNEYFAVHHWPWVDFVTGLAYILFVYWAFAFVIYLGIFRRNDPAMKTLLLQYGWVFCAVNLAGFATYYIYPAAPPWYAAQYGFGPANFAVAASPAAAIRWDELTGLHYFAGFYGRSADIFGAIPSLHVAYPLLVFIYGRHVEKLSLNIANFLFYLLVCFSAVYLQHHYVLDVLIGSAYALVGYALERGITKYRSQQRRLAAA